MSFSDIKHRVGEISRRYVNGTISVRPSLISILDLAGTGRLEE